VKRLSIPDTEKAKGLICVVYPVLGYQVEVELKIQQEKN
jgi:hypothetical protein